MLIETITVNFKASPNKLYNNAYIYFKGNVQLTPWVHTTVEAGLHTALQASSEPGTCWNGAVDSCEGNTGTQSPWSVCPS